MFIRPQKSKHGYYRHEEFMKTFCRDLRENAPKTVNCEKFEMMPLTKRGKKSHHKQKICCVCKGKFEDDGHKSYQKLRVQCSYTCKYRGAAYSICNLKVNPQKKSLQY